VTIRAHDATRRVSHAWALAAVLLIGAGCGTDDGSADAPAIERDGPMPPVPQRSPDTPDLGTAGGADAGAESDPYARPDWLGTRVLPPAADGFGRRLPTPPELVDRRLRPPHPPSSAPPPPEDGAFRSSVGPVPHEVVARSTWNEDCPVALEDLRYLNVTFVGFDGLSHTGELLVHAEVADDVAAVFATLHAARFPLEEVRVIDAPELDLPPTGDGNVTSAFVCRATVGGTRWSEHAYGRAIDINPFHNPYVRGDLIIPELAGSYVDRSDVRPGMIVAGDVVTEAFERIGWRWGGDWTGAATDPMHFSTSGR